VSSSITSLAVCGSWSTSAVCACAFDAASAMADASATLNRLRSGVNIVPSRRNAGSANQDADDAPALVLVAWLNGRRGARRRGRPAYVFMRESSPAMDGSGETLRIRVERAEPRAVSWKIDVACANVAAWQP